MVSDNVLGGSVLEMFGGMDALDEGPRRRGGSVVGQTFNRLTVIEEVEGTRPAKVRCRCSCGAEKVTQRHSVIYGNTKSCGCIQRASDYTGQKFGMLTVIKVNPDIPGPHIHYLCRCDCGEEVTVRRNSLRPGHTESCGCKNRTDIIPTGTVQGSWAVLAYEKSKTTTGANRYAYRCRCACGVESLVESLSTGLASNMCKSCVGPRRARPNTQSNNVWHSYRIRAKKKSIPFDLTPEALREIILQDCSYCGSPPSSVTLPNTSYGKPLLHGGVDRKNSDLGYTESNCAPSCGTCNCMKAAMSVEDFTAWARRVVEGPYPSRVYPLTLSQANKLSNEYRNRARREASTHTLTNEEMHDLFRRSCHYCGVAPSNCQSSSYYKGGREKTKFFYNGVDRVSPDSGYGQGNVTTACWACNNAKGDMPLSDFLAHIRRITAYCVNSTR